MKRNNNIFILTRSFGFLSIMHWQRSYASFTDIDLKSLINTCSLLANGYILKYGNLYIRRRRPNTSYWKQTPTLSQELCAGLMARPLFCDFPYMYETINLFKNWKLTRLISQMSSFNNSFVKARPPLFLERIMQHPFTKKFRRWNIKYCDLIKEILLILSCSSLRIFSEINEIYPLSTCDSTFSKSKW